MKSNHYTMLARNAIKQSLSTISDTDNIGVGCSGGADSTAILIGLSTLYRGENAKKVHVVIINHKLQEITDTISLNTAKLAESYGFNAHIIPVTIEETPNGAEADARNARYNAFNTMITQHNLQSFLIGHTKNDQAEQVFLGMLRGSGTKSLSGIPETRGIFTRPFLNTVSRKETQEVCVENNVDYWCDPHNDSLIYKRVSVRKLIKATEESTGQNIVDSLVRTAQISAEDTEALDYYTNLATEQLEQTNWNVETLQKLPTSVRKRAYRAKLATLEAKTDSLSFKIVTAIDTLITDWTGQGAVSITNSITVQRKKGHLVFKTS